MDTSGGLAFEKNAPSLLMPSADFDDEGAKAVHAS